MFLFEKVTFENIPDSTLKLVQMPKTALKHTKSMLKLKRKNFTEKKNSKMKTSFGISNNTHMY